MEWSTEQWLTENTEKGIGTKTAEYAPLVKLMQKAMEQADLFCANTLDNDYLVSQVAQQRKLLQNATAQLVLAGRYLFSVHFEYTTYILYYTRFGVLGKQIHISLQGRPMGYTSIYALYKHRITHNRSNGGKPSQSGNRKAL